VRLRRRGIGVGHGSDNPLSIGWMRNPGIPKYNLRYIRLFQFPRMMTRILFIFMASN
jgi:hypothetical protein